ncbi:hypothetical protein [Actinoplanes sp. NPDC020271]|uniref:hypothetical protein n=1 Tax=Actinoplanes sp. NPDC020271 TaxID=3363896 RepID=UPI0037931BE2
MAEDLGTVLRQEAERHVPDSDAMFDRINRRRFAPEPVQASRPFLRLTGLRPVAAAASVVATLVAGFTGIKILTGDEPRRAPAATTGTTSVAPAPTRSAPLPERTSARPKRTGDGGGGTRAVPHSSPASAPPSFQPVAGFLSSRGAINAYSTTTWAQSDVTVTTAKEITALELAISIARTDGVRSTGSWSTIPSDMITLTVIEQKDALVYRFTLKPGGKLAAGDYVFAGQYEHAAGKRDAGADLYGAICSAGDQKSEVTGAFTAS